MHTKVGGSSRNLLGNFNCNPSRWAAHCTHTHAESRNCYFDFTCHNDWAQAMWWKRIGEPEQNIFWSPLPGCHWLTLHALFCRWFYWKTKGLPHFQLEGWARYFVLNLSKLCMFPTLFVQRVTNLQLETWPGSKASGSIKPRVKTTENGLRTGRRHGRWLAAMQQSGTYFFPLSGGPMSKLWQLKLKLIWTCHAIRPSLFRNAARSSEDCGMKWTPIPMTHHFRRFLNCGLQTGDDMSWCDSLFVDVRKSVHLDLYCERSWHTRKKLW